MEMKTVHIGDLGEIKTGSTPSKKNPDNYGDYALWITKNILVLSKKCFRRKPLMIAVLD